MITQITIPDYEPILSVHNPIGILIEVYYDNIGERPYNIECVIKEADELNTFNIDLGTFRPSIYIDEPNKVTFRLDGSELFFAFIDDFEDHLSKDRVVEFLPKMTNVIEITVNTLESGNDISEVFYPVLVNSSCQIGEDFAPQLYISNDIFYVGAENEVVYIYVWSDNDAPIVKDTTKGVFDEVYLSDYDDVTFTDFNEAPFVANILD